VLVSSADRVRDVIVVGAGPAGAAVAARLHQHGVRDVLVVDRYDFPRDKPCGGGLTGHIDEALAAVDLRLTVPTLASPSATVRCGGFARTVTMGRPVQVIRRLEFDASLVEQVRAKGVEVATGVAIDRVVPAADPGRAGHRRRRHPGRQGRGRRRRRGLDRAQAPDRQRQGPAAPAVHGRAADREGRRRDGLRLHAHARRPARLPVVVPGRRRPPERRPHALPVVAPRRPRAPGDARPHLDGYGVALPKKGPAAGRCGAITRRRRWRRRA
jgi:choline dehydrogenase-like flavoprotein